MFLTVPPCLRCGWGHSDHRDHPKPLSRCRAGLDLEADPFVPLKECDHLKHVLGVRIPRRAKHAHQALRGTVYGLSEFGVPHRGVDEIP